MRLMLVALVLIAAGACGDSRPLAERRAACYPPCLAMLVLRCPLVSACVVSEEPDPSIGQSLSETQGVATCFDSGERLRRGLSLVGDVEHYRVTASNGSPCYEAIGRFPSYEIHAGGALVATILDQRVTDLLGVTCNGQTTTIELGRTSNVACDRLPWDPAATCNPGGGCTFGPISAP